MNAIQILAYLTGAAGYAAVAALVIVTVGAIAGWKPTFARVGLVLSTSFVVFLGLSPFPEASEVVCREPILKPFRFLEGYVRLWHRGAPLTAWLQSPTFTSPIMNFVFFAGVGGFLATQSNRLVVAFAFGAGLSGFIEIAQITGLFGFYPCAYRYFEVDDLILNIGGVVTGAALWRSVQARHRRDAPDFRPPVTEDPER